MEATQTPDPNVKHIIFKGQTEELRRNPSTNFWKDQYGTLFAYAYDGDSVDHRNACGVGFFSLADGNPLNEACTPHDFAYDTPVYQAFHTRDEADHYLGQLLKQVPGYEHSLTPELFEWLARQEGFHFWENPATNN